MQATSKPATTPTATLLTLNNEITSSDTLPTFVPIFMGSLGVLKLGKAIISPAQYPALPWLMAGSGLRPWLLILGDCIKD